MNYRIKDLASQAQDFASTKCGDEFGGVDEYLRRRLFQEKFAELIIKECAEQLCDQKFRNADNDSKILVGQGLILNHFGVE